MACEQVNKSLVCYSPLAGDDGGPSYGISTFQETLELSQLGSVVQLPEILRLLCQIFT